MFGIAVEVSQNMVGAKKAVMIGERKVVVSPAMFDLLKNAETQAELRLLLENIPMIRIPEPPSIYEMPMVTRWDS